LLSLAVAAKARVAADVLNSDGLSHESGNDCKACRAQVYFATAPLGPLRSMIRRVVDLCTPAGCHVVKSDGHFSLNPRRVLLSELL
jgi:hypothetical protein